MGGAAPEPCTRKGLMQRIDAKLLYWSRVALHQELQCGAGSEQKKSFGMKMCEKEIQFKKKKNPKNYEIK